MRSTATTCALLLGIHQSRKVHAQSITCPATTDLPSYKSATRECLDAGCTANDVKVGKLTNSETVGSCTSLTDTISFTTDVQMEVTVGPGRYDLGLYIGSGETCEVFTFACNPDAADDGDGCGDMLGTSESPGGLNFYTDIEFTVDCNVVDGQLPFPYCTVWDNNVNTECLGPEVVEPGTTSKCKCSDTEVSVPLCLAFIESSLFEVVLPSTCPLPGEDIVVTIPDGAIVATMGTTDPATPVADLVITVANSDEAFSVDVDYSPGTDLELTLPSVSTDFTLSVYNPNFGGCTSSVETFSLDCYPCDPNPCGDNEVCVDNGDFTHTCECAENYEDTTDDSVLNCTPIDPCDPNPCGDNEVCIDNGDVTYTCLPVTCETSFGCEVVEGVGEDQSCASPELNDIEGIDANRWGWYLEPTFDGTGQVFTFDMYAGAGQNVLTNGAYAGNVVVTVNPDGSSDYEVYPGNEYCFDDVHLHVGNELPTQTKGRTTTTTVAPGQYTQTALHEGTFYIIVHVGETCTPCGH